MIRSKRRLIVDVSHGVPYVYVEDNTHFRNVESQRPNRLPHSLLNNDCELLQHGDGHFVFDLCDKQEFYGG